MAMAQASHPSLPWPPLAQACRSWMTVTPPGSGLQELDDILGVNLLLRVAQSAVVRAVFACEAVKATVAHTTSPCAGCLTLIHVVIYEGLRVLQW